MSIPYFNLHGFEYVYLEDSYVLDIEQSEDKFSLLVELVLNELHPLYVSPSPEAQYCYRKGRIIFSHMTSVCWNKKMLKKIFSVNGEEDYGNIDSFYREDGVYVIAGEWGEVSITSDTEPEICFL